MSSAFMALAVSALALLPAAGQEHPHEEEKSTPESSGDPHEGHTTNASDGPLGLPHAREASGTAWQPDSTPMHAHHAEFDEWSFMAHGNFFAGYDSQGTGRGDSQWIAPNWMMFMGKRRAGGGELMLRHMLSLDPLTLTQRGYPLLLQTGESFEGEPLHDRQHPHDLFMEIAALYTFPLSESLALQVYGGPSGEPALGPVAFPHRLSASSDPMAPLGHHWQDSTHISFGVLTAGVMTRVFKLEGSVFNGREPDEHRYNIEFHDLDSYSGRMWLNPSDAWSFQVSYGYLKSPEEHRPSVNVHRSTASAAYSSRVGDSGFLAATAVFGKNEPSEGRASSSWLLEANYDTGGRKVLFGRMELVEKSGEELVLPAAFSSEIFSITSLVAGCVRKLQLPLVTMGFGVRASVDFIDDDLASFYGRNHPWGYMIFMQMHPSNARYHSVESNRALE